MPNKFLLKQTNKQKLVILDEPEETEIENFHRKRKVKNFV